MLLSKVLEGVAVLEARGVPPRAVTGVASDSRKVRRGALFVALPGSRTDGALFVADALRRGAAGVLTEAALAGLPDRAYAARVGSAAAALSAAAANFWGRPSGRLAVVGITGTNGKTTTSYFLERILQGAGRKTGVLGTVDYRLGYKVIAAAPNTTPVASELHALLAQMLRRGASHAVLEVSSHALALGRVADLDLDGAVFTNLARDHLDFHKTRAAYCKAKARLFEMLDAGRKPRRFAVLNADDPASPRLRAKLRAGVAVRTYGLTGAADHAATGVEATLFGTGFAWRQGRRARRVRLHLLGRHNVYNALAAGAAALELGLSWEQAAHGLEALRGVPGRLESVPNEHGIHVLVDYAHTDSALEGVLQQIHALPHRRIYTVFGCGGDRDRTKRGPMGRAAVRWSDLAVVTSDNPRREDPGRILRDIVQGIRGIPLDNYKVIPDRREAIRHAIAQARPGDTVLIAGKGHETTQILGERTLHFDDREVALEALGARRPAVWT